MHPFVKILLFIFIFILMNFLSQQYIFFLSAAICLIAAKIDARNLKRVTKRMRWLFISIFLIYAFDTPGQFVQEFPFAFSPTIEGCVSGLLQIAKLLIAIATLSILFSSTSKERLMTGLYLLLGCCLLLNMLRIWLLVIILKSILNVWKL